MKFTRSYRHRRAWTLGGLLVLSLLAIPGTADAQDELDGVLQVTDAVRVTDDDAAPARTYTSPQVLIHPDDPMIAVASAVEMRSRICHLFRSNDGGRSWELLDALPSPPEFPFCFHTSGTSTQSPIAWGSDGTLYYAMAGWGAQENVDVGSEHGGLSGNLSVLLARSDDLGDTWETTVVRDTRSFRGEEIENNRPVQSVAVDTSGDEDTVYVGWRRNLPAIDDAPSTAQVAVSTDGGETFGEPLNPLESYFGDTSGEHGSGAPNLAVGDDGTLFALVSADDPSGEGPDSLVLARSTDLGQTFTSTVASPPSAYYADEQLAWSPEGGERGSVHIVYEDKIDPPPGAGERDIYYRRSTDGGDTWGDAVKINDDDPDMFYVQVTPNVSVAPDGRVDVAWWDFRNDPGLFVNDAYYAFSEDNGESWSDNIRVSDVSSDRKIGTWSNGYDMRAPVGIGSADSFALLGWEDTRLGDPVTQTQDVFASNVQFEELETGLSSGVRYALAAMAGLALTGLVLLVASPLLGRGGRRKS